METNTIYQQKDRSWMVNVAFYFPAAALALAIFSYAVFYVKTQLQIQKIAAIDRKIAVYGTQEQKQHEAQVFDYKKKIDDFALVVDNHAMSSNIFTFLEANTLPGLAFSSFSMSGLQHEIRLSGEADDMAVLGKQFGVFEENKEHIRHISVLNSKVTALGKIAFTFNIDLRSEEHTSEL